MTCKELLNFGQFKRDFDESGPCRAVSGKYESLKNMPSPGHRIFRAHCHCIVLDACMRGNVDEKMYLQFAIPVQLLIFGPQNDDLHQPKLPGRRLPTKELM
jgi:hypothetical protein